MGGKVFSHGLRGIRRVFPPVLIGIVLACTIPRAHAIDPNPVVPARPANPSPLGHVPVAGAPAPAPMPVTITYVFNDAVNLKNLIAGGDTNSTQVWAIFKAYHVTPANIGANPFLKHIGFLASRKDVLIQASAPNQLQGLTGASPWSASGVADALGTLIAQRFKEEAELLALQDLARTMTDPKNAKLNRTLKAGLPRTMGYLDTISPDTLDLNDWSILQSDFRVDMQALPDNLPAFFNTQFDLTASPDRRYAVYMGVAAAAEINQHGRSPYAVLDGLERQSASFSAPNCAGQACEVILGLDMGLDVAAIVSHLLTQNGSTTWHSTRDVEDLIGYSSLSTVSSAADTKLDGLNLLLGLSYAVDTPLYTKLDTWLRNHSHLALADWDTATLTSAAGMVDGLATAFEGFQTKSLGIPNTVITASDLRPLIDGLQSLGVATVTQLAAFTHSSADTSSVTLVVQRLDAVVDLVADIKAKAYPAAVGEVLSFVRSFIIENTSQAAQDPVYAFLESTGPFIAQVAAAKTSAEVEVALQNFALPAGSYVRVQQEHFSVTLNSYFGVTAGAETLLGGLEGTGAARTRAHLGFTAPVGLGFNWGKVQNSGKSTASDTRLFQTGSWSLFAPILDVGAVASWRLGSGGGQVPPITWANIVAPGLYVVWTRKNTPFSIMFGAQYGPELTKISTGGGATIERAALQFPSIQFTFDIPVLFLYQNPKWPSSKP